MGTRIILKSVSAFEDYVDNEPVIELAERTVYGDYRIAKDNVISGNCIRGVGSNAIGVTKFIDVSGATSITVKNGRTSASGQLGYFVDINGNILSQITYSEQSAVINDKIVDIPSDAKYLIICLMIENGSVEIEGYLVQENYTSITVGTFTENAFVKEDGTTQESTAVPGRGYYDINVVSDKTICVLCKLNGGAQNGTAIAFYNNNQFISSLRIPVEIGCYYLALLKVPGNANKAKFNFTNAASDLEDVSVFCAYVE